MSYLDEYNKSRLSNPLQSNYWLFRSITKKKRLVYYTKTQ